ncbi:MAG: hypothetical protein NCW75_12565 [Phycisphaera sp.]|nr:MAG: hypothetical protein NCW75_12565 [Phycisphaera sp.]
MLDSAEDADREIALTAGDHRADNRGPAVLADGDVVLLLEPQRLTKGAWRLVPSWCRLAVVGLWFERVLCACSACGRLFFYTDAEALHL